MPQRDDFSPERLDALVDGNSTGASGSEEEAMAAMLTELRATEGASPELRARVQGMVQPRETAGARLARRLRGTSWTQRALAFAPACVLVVGAVFAVSSMTQDDGPAVSSDMTAPQEERVRDAPAAAGPPEAAPSRGSLTAATLTIRVADPAEIAAAADRSRGIATSRGGRTATERLFRTAGRPRQAVVTLEVPANRYDETRVALAGLGTIAEESISYGTGDSVAGAPSPAGSLLSGAPTATITVTFVAR